jgi:hypothetical protein
MAVEERGSRKYEEGNSMTKTISRFQKMAREARL